jgi:RRXRR protein/HNH endonuclease
MLVYVQNIDKQPLMPTSPVKARTLLKAGKAKVVSKTPFTIRLTYNSTIYVQPLTHGVDTGSSVIGSAVAGTDGRVYYASEVTVRNDIRERMDRRRKYRQNRRQRKTRYRAKRFDNRKNSRRKGRFSPTMRSKFDAHHKEIRFVSTILPISMLILETGTFDPHALKNPAVLEDKSLYQKGPNYGYENTKAYVLNRDRYTCQHCAGKSNDKLLHVHHIVFRRNLGSDEQENLVVLCKTCHDDLHDGKFALKLSGKKKGKLKHATQMNSIRVQLLKAYPDAVETFGYITKANRQQSTDQKSHALDAAFIATEGVKPHFLTTITVLKTCIPDGDYQRSKGIRSETRIPGGKVLGFRKFDKVRYRGKTYFVKGRFSTGYAILMDEQGQTAKLKPIPKFSLMKRISARKSWRITQQNTLSF